ncbi:MAG: hypothetical protein R3C18_19810 [Planctomycetaceae bacterium]
MVRQQFLLGWTLARLLQAMKLLGWDLEPFYWDDEFVTVTRKFGDGTTSSVHIQVFQPELNIMGEHVEALLRTLGEHPSSPFAGSDRALEELGKKMERLRVPYFHKALAAEIIAMLPVMLPTVRSCMKYWWNHDRGKFHAYARVRREKRRQGWG